LLCFEGLDHAAHHIPGSEQRPASTGDMITRDFTLRQYWEFVRRYMEEGPKDAAQRVEFLIPIASRRETLAEGFHRMHAERGSNVIMSVIFAALATVSAPGRWFAMRTSKIPRWPDEIEASCQPPASDPFAIGMQPGPVV
jgi:hypothetical protein